MRLCHPLSMSGPAHGLLALVGAISHTEKVIELEQQTWVNLLGFAGFGLALLGYLASMKRDLKTEIGGAPRPAPTSPTSRLTSAGSTPG